jgi:hypothetical protein
LFGSLITASSDGALTESSPKRLPVTISMVSTCLKTNLWLPLVMILVLWTYSETPQDIEFNPGLSELTLSTLFVSNSEEMAWTTTSSLLVVTIKLSVNGDRKAHEK